MSFRDVVRRNTPRSLAFGALFLALSIGTDLWRGRAPEFDAIALRVGVATLLYLLVMSWLDWRKQK